MNSNHECQWYGCENTATTYCNGPLPGEKNWACDEHKDGCGVIPVVDAEPGIAQMRKELAESGWLERNSTTYISPNGQWVRGPYGAWKAMKKLAAADRGYRSSRQ